MIPIREASYRVGAKNWRYNNKWTWYLITSDDIGMSKENDSNKMFETRPEALASWKEFAACNNITKWEVVE